MAAAVERILGVKLDVIPNSRSTVRDCEDSGTALLSSQRKNSDSSEITHINEGVLTKRDWGTLVL